MPLQIMLLGGFEIRLETAEPIGLDQPRLQLLAGYLLLHANVPQLRSHLSFIFWPDSTESQARTNLRKLLHTLRNIHPALNQALVLTNETVCWHVHPEDRVDVVQFRAALVAADITANGHSANGHSANGAGERARDKLRAAVGHYTGELLPGHYDNWVLTAREELHLSYVNALAELVERCIEAREYAAALPLAQRLVQSDDLQESSYRILIRLHLELGDTAAAMRVYHACARRLRDELGVDPGPETESLYARILRAGDATQGDAVASPEPEPERRASFGSELVGRRAEWQKLRRVWQDAQRGHPQLVVIRGEPGIGKTRLAQELVETARRQGCATLAARAYAAEGRTAYGPVADLLRTETALRALGTLDATWRLELGRILPELTPQGREPLEPLRESWQQRRFHESLVRGCLAQGSPLLVHLDDLQWFDAETLTWLHFLLRYDTTAPILVLGTLRSEELTPDHPYHDLHRGLTQTGILHEIALTALSADHVAELATRLTGAALPETANTALFQSTEGNPLFVLETLQALYNTNIDVQSHSAEDIATEIATGIAAALVRAQQSATLTPRVQAVIQARLAQLSANARQLIRLAAVLGRHFTFELLQSVSSASTDQNAQPDTLGLVNALDELWQRRIIREHDVNAYDFSHDRIREVVYAEISPVLRPHLHAQVAATLERLHASELGAAASQIAAHYVVAGQAAQAATYYIQAAHYAHERFAHTDAIAHAQRALKLTPAHELQAQFENCDLLESIYRLVTARSDERFANLQQLGELADRLYAQAQTAGADSPEAQTALAQRARVKTLLGGYYSASGQVQRAISTAQEAVVLAQTAEALPELAHALLCLGYSGYWVAGDMMAARRELLRAVELAQSLGMDELEAICLEQLSAAGMYSGMSAQDIVNNLMRALSIHEKNNNLYLQSGLLNKFGYIVMAQGEGEYTPVLEHYGRALELSRRIGYEFNECVVADNMGIMYVAHGDYAQAEHWLQECRRLAAKIDFLLYIAVNLSFLSYLRANQGRLDEAVEFGRTSVAYFSEPGIHHRATESYSLLGYAEYLRGDLVDAQKHLERALQLARNNGDRRFEATALARLGHVYLAQDRLNDARHAFEQSYKLRQSLQQYRRSLEPQAGLAQVAKREYRPNDARALAAQIFAKLEEITLEFTAEAFQVYVTCYEILCADEDPRAEIVQQWATAHLERISATLLTDERPAFDALPLHRTFLSALPTPDPVLADTP